MFLQYAGPTYTPAVHNNVNKQCVNIRCDAIRSEHLMVKCHHQHQAMLCYAVLGFLRGYIEIL